MYSIVRRSRFRDNRRAHVLADCFQFVRKPADSCILGLQSRPAGSRVKKPKPLYRKNMSAFTVSQPRQREDIGLRRAPHHSHDDPGVAFDVWSTSGDILGEPSVSVQRCASFSDTWCVPFFVRCFCRSITL